MWLPLVCPLPGTWPATQAWVPTGNQTSDPLIRRPALNPLSHTSLGKYSYFKWGVRRSITKEAVSEPRLERSGEANHVQHWEKGFQPQEQHMERPSGGMELTSVPVLFSGNSGLQSEVPHSAPPGQAREASFIFKGWLHLRSWGLSGLSLIHI